jgi:hypothetical protein
MTLLGTPEKFGLNKALGVIVSITTRHGMVVMRPSQLRAASKHDHEAVVRLVARRRLGFR